MPGVDQLERLMAEKRIKEKDFPLWKETFSSELRYEQLHEDHQAWQSVTGTLLAIISIGVTLAVVTVYLCAT
jgi:hypothetical protein